MKVILIVKVYPHKQANIDLDYTILEKCNRDYPYLY